MGRQTVGLLDALGRVRACGELSAQAVLEAYVRQEVAAEREACARLCEELLGFDMDDPGQTAADAIRGRSPELIGE